MIFTKITTRKCEKNYLRKQLIVQTVYLEKDLENPVNLQRESPYNQVLRTKNYITKMK